MEPDTRDEVVDFVGHWSKRFACVTAAMILKHLSLQPSKYHDWKKRYGRENRHNGKIPRDFWLLPEEKEAIVLFYLEHRLDGYRRCAYMMIDRDIVCCSPSTVYRVLLEYDVLRRWNRKSGRKGQGFDQPEAPHEHWHIDVSYVNLGGSFYYLISILDGYSRFIVHWDIRQHMREQDIQLVVQRAHELYPGSRPRIISDNGTQFVSRDFKELIRQHGMTHVRTSPYYPQSNGKLERWHKTIKSECIRPGCPLTIEDARRLVERYVKEYNDKRLHSAIGYLTPRTMLEQRADEVHRERDRKLEQARSNRRQRNRKNRRNHSVSKTEFNNQQLEVC